MTQRYDTYKDSGVQWLGEIPGHWKQFQFRKFFKIKKVIAGKEGFDVLAITQQGIKIKDITRNEGQLAANYSGYQIVNPTDFAMNHMDLLTGYIDISKYYGVTSPDYRVFTNISEEADSKYYLYIFQLCYKRKIFFGLGQGVANKGRWRLPAVQLNKFYLPLPPLSEQHSIVSYLDDKCGKIDKMLEGKQKQIELLAEMKQRIIADAVTRGINPDVKMKATNIPWLPEIPEHWNCIKLKAFSKDNKEKNKGNVESCVLSLSYGNVIVKQNVNFGLVPDNYENYQIVKPGYIILRLTDLQNDHKSLRTGLVKNRGIITSAYVGLVVNNINHEYVHLLLHSYDVMKVFYGMGGGLRQSMSYQDISNLYIPVPPISEQRAIVSYITKKTAKIDTLTSKLQQEIESIKEYKQRLISDVVTGQIKVC